MGDDGDDKVKPVTVEASTAQVRTRRSVGRTRIQRRAAQLTALIHPRPGYCPPSRGGSGIRLNKKSAMFNGANRRAAYHLARVSRRPTPPNLRHFCGPPNRDDAGRIARCSSMRQSSTYHAAWGGECSSVTSAGGLQHIRQRRGYAYPTSRPRAGTAHHPATVESTMGPVTSDRELYFTLGVAPRR